MNQIPKNYRKRADECYKERNNGEDCSCEISNTIRLNPWCHLCKKLEGAKRAKKRTKTLKLSLKEEKLQSKEIETPKYEIERFKFPIDLIEFPLKRSTNLKKIKGKSKLELFLSGYYGDYHVDMPRRMKLMDLRTLLATLYFVDCNKNKIFEEKFTNYFHLLKVPDTPFYRKSITEGYKFLLHLLFYTPYIYDLENKQRNIKFNLTDKGEVDWENLPKFSMWHLLDSVHYEDKKRQSSIKVIVGTAFYERIFKSDFFTLVDIKKILPLKDIALNLYLLIERQDPKYIKNYTINFKNLKDHIGITTKHITRAREIFEKAWSDIKDRKLLEGYRYKIFISKKNGEEYIKFVKQRSLRH